MRLHAVERLYNAYIVASDAASRGHGRSQMLDLEKQICAELDRAHGHVTIRDMHFHLHVAIIGAVRFEYFKMVVMTERRVSDVACSFPRRSTDVPAVIPVAAIQKPWRDPRATRPHVAGKVGAL